MRRRVITWTTLTLLLAGLCLMLASFPVGGRGFDYYHMGLGYSLSFLGMTFSILGRWPKPGQVDSASLVFMAVAELPSWLVALGTRWRIRWRLMAHIAWGMLLLLALTTVAVALVGDSGDAIFLEAVVMMLNIFGSLIVMMARLPAGQRQQ